MRRLGLVGGTSWVSSEHYYRQLNEGIATRFGGSASAPVTLWSVEFGELARMQHDGDWAGVARVLADAARRLVDAGCAGIALVGLLGTRFTMAGSLFPDRLTPRGVDVLVPAESEQQRVHDVIYDELTRGVVSDEARSDYLTVIDKLVADGAEAVLLACTEQGMLLRDGDASVPLLDTTEIHCHALIDFIAGDE